MAIRVLLKLVLILTLALPVAVRSQDAYLLTPEVSEGDVARMVVEFRNNVISLFALDTTPLEVDFEVLEVRPAVGTEVREGKTVNVMRWEVDLVPKRTGRMEVPSLMVKGNPTPRLALKVFKGQDPVNADQRIWVESSPDNIKPMVGEQVTVTVRLYHNRPLVTGFLSEPDVPGANAIRMFADRGSSEVIDGERIAFLERKIALFATEPGRLIFPAVEYIGDVQEQLAGENEDPEAGRRRIYRRSSPIELDVLPIPGEYSGRYWLPVTELQVTQEWRGVEETLDPGESIVRTLTMRATGLPEMFLPGQLLTDSQERFEVYPDEEFRTQHIDGDRIVGEIQQSHVIVPTGTGSLDLPPIRISYWSLPDNRERTIVLEGITLDVNAPSATAPPEIPNTGEVGGPDSTVSDPVFQPAWASIAILVLVALFTIMIFGYRRAGKTDAVKRFSRSRLKRVCITGNAREAREQLLIWSRACWPEQHIYGLNQVKRLVESDSFKSELAALEAALYGNSSRPWQGKELWKCFQSLTRAAVTKDSRSQDDLPPLYPKPISLRVAQG